MTLIKGKKVWKDGNNQDGKRPNSIIVNLLADGVQIDAKEVTAQDDWAYSFDNLPKYNTGKIIDYTVSENTVPEYQSAIEGTTITNTYVPKVIDINVKKEWRDTNNQDGIRPESIDVQLYAHDKKIGRPVTLTEENGWTHTWENLPEKEDGKTIEYSVKEVSDVPGYESGLKQENKTDIVITNTHIPEVTKIAGKKMWNDHQDREGKRPEKITINLLADGFKVDSQEVTAQDNWTYSFNNLPKYKAGKLIQYTVTENTVPDYSTHIDGTTITNEYTPGKTSITVTKAWDDNNNQDGIRPDSISVQFYANGKKVGKVVELNEKNNWTVTKEDLKEKEAGKMIEYTVKEVGKVEGYEVSINNDNKGNIILTNTHTPEQTPKKDDNNSTPSLNTKESSTNSPVSGSKTVEGTKNLPSTGEKNNNWLIIIGSILILLVAVYLWIKRKK
ncbi:Cna B-type domain-containing protein [Enterococcus hermanniensis]|uniref:Collagen Binding Protein n=1 Tax=Enterococcus hermanniensis TaxID=249189 RepID=A0A1L8TQ06_9ENTE|nr:Cna B-type domain-containing protein [Enterococcus hermanniensis]OJG46202.1 Collagen Binding Protein [Enterococcus hermanniensis]